MAIRVPDVPEPRVALRPLSSTNYAMTAQAKVGSLSGLSEPLHKLKAAAEVADNLRVEEQVNALRRKQIELTNAYAQQLGKNVLPDAEGKTFTEKQQEQFDSAATELGNNLVGAQKELFTRRSALLANEFRSGVAAHEAKQLSAHDKSVKLDTITLETDAAKADWKDPNKMALHNTRVLGAVDGLAASQGLDATGKELLRQDAMTKMHLGVLGSAARSGDIAFAKDYLLQHGDDLSQEAREKAQEFIDNKEAVLRVNSTVDAVWADGALNYEQKAAKIRDSFADNPDAQKDAIQELGQRRQQHDVAQGEAYGSVWDMISGLNPKVRRMSLSNIKTTQAWDSLDGEQRKKFVSDYEAYTRRNEGRSTPEDNLNKAIATIHLMDNPRGLLAKSDEELKGMVGVLGASNVLSLIERKRSIASGLANQEEKLRRAELDVQQFKSIATDSGILKKKMKNNDIVQYERLRLATNDAITAQQQKLGRMLTPDEQEPIIRKLLVAVAVKSIWGGRTKPAFQVTLEDLPITDAVKTRAIGFLRGNGKLVTPEAVMAVAAEMEKE